MKSGSTLLQLSARGQITLPAEVRRLLGLNPGDAFQIAVDEGRIVLQPVEVTPVELYSNERIKEFLANSELTDEELAVARRQWGL